MTEIMHPSGRVARALVNLRAEVMQALADAATMSADTGPCSMRSMIKDERKRLGLSLKEVANRASITKSHMWELEQGRAVNPTIWTVYGLSRALGADLRGLQVDRGFFYVGAGVSQVHLSGDRIGRFEDEQRLSRAHDRAFIDEYVDDATRVGGKDRCQFIFIKSDFPG